MYSPYGAVQGHDTTYIRRMSVEEYLQELKEEEADVRGETPPTRPADGVMEGKTSSLASSPRPLRQYEQRRSALSSRNPNVVFSSKYPMYDRLGRELCVAFQVQDMAVQQELRRLEDEGSRGRGRDSRRSGVRLSAELPMESDTTGGSRFASVYVSAATAEGHEQAQAEGAQTHLTRPSHLADDSFANVEVSATSQYPSVSGSCASSLHPVSSRPSEFSIFRDGDSFAAVGVNKGAIMKACTSVVTRPAPEEAGILIHRGGEGGPPREASLPSATSSQRREDVETRHSHWPRQSEKRNRSRSNGGRLSRVRFVNENSDSPLTGGVREPVTRAGGAAPLPPRPPTPPPVPLEEHNDSRAETTINEDATRWTTRARTSTAVRATKQLFRNTTHMNTSSASRATTTLTYKQLITSNAYGMVSTAIAVNKVWKAMEQNVRSCTAVMSPSNFLDIGAEVSKSAPELHCGDVISLGTVQYRIVRFHAVAEVYEALQMTPLVQTESSPSPCPERVGSNGIERVVDEPSVNTEADARAEQADNEKRDLMSPVMDREAASAQGDATEPPSTVAVQQLIDRELNEAGSPLSSPKSKGKEEKPVSSAAPSPLHFLYCWRSTGLPHGADEARRAALGLSLTSPQIRVSGYRYDDGTGITALSLPVGYRAISLSALPLSLGSFKAVLRLVLKTFSAMVARRTVQGSLAALGELFLAWPAEQERQAPWSLLGENPAAGMEAPAPFAHGEPLLIPFHWERWVDFGLFVDRAAGRTIPFDFEDGTAQSIITHGSDLRAVLQLFLEHPLAAELTSEQYIHLQKLLVMTSEPTQVANELIQIQNLMRTLPCDMAELLRSLNTAVLQSSE